MPRRLIDHFLQAYWRIQRPLTLGVRGIVQHETGKILLIRHTYTPGWHLPGGGVEKHETCATALVRELKEEANVTAVIAPTLISVHANHSAFPNDHVLLYRIDEWQQDAFTPTKEIAEITFADPSMPPEGTTRATRQRLKEVFAKAPVSENW